METIETLSSTSSTSYAANLSDLTAVYEPRVNVVMHSRVPELVAFSRGTLLAYDWNRVLHIDKGRRGLGRVGPEGMPEHDEHRARPMTARTEASW